MVDYVAMHIKVSEILERRGKEKYFISYRDKNKRPFFLAFEYGWFFLVDKTGMQHLSKNEVIRLLLLINNKSYQIIGQGQYRASIFA